MGIEIKNRLSLIKEIDIRRFGRKYGLYRCECGIEKELAICMVNANKVKSCGCAWKQKAPEIEVMCPCGVVFYVNKKRHDSGKGSFCSMSCKYKYRKMPKRGKGTYLFTKENTGRFTADNLPANRNIFKKGRIPENHKGDLVGYDALHDWVKRELGKPNKCEHCGTETAKRFEWANKSHEYKRDITDWIRLCKICHIKYDRENNDEKWGVATKKFNLSKRKKK